MKYQIFGPNGNKVCIVEAGDCRITVCNLITFFESAEFVADVLFSIPRTWAAIPLENIVKDESKEIEEIVNELKKPQLPDKAPLETILINKGFTKKREVK